VAAEIATYTIKVTVRSDDESAKPLKISDLEVLVQEGIEDEYDTVQDVADVDVNVSASRDDA